MSLGAIQQGTPAFSRPSQIRFAMPLSWLACERKILLVMRKRRLCSPELHVQWGGCELSGKPVVLICVLYRAANSRDRGPQNQPILAANSVSSPPCETAFAG